MLLMVHRLRQCQPPSDSTSNEWVDTQKQSRNYPNDSSQSHNARHLTSPLSHHIFTTGSVTHRSTTLKLIQLCSQRKSGMLGCGCFQHVLYHSRASLYVTSCQRQEERVGRVSSFKAKALSLTFVSGI